MTSPDQVSPSLFQRYSVFIPSFKTKTSIVVAIVVIGGLGLYLAAYRPDLALRMFSWKVVVGFALAGLITWLYPTREQELRGKISCVEHLSTEEYKEYFSSKSYDQIETIFFLSGQNKEIELEKQGLPIIRMGNRLGTLVGIIRAFKNDEEFLKAMAIGLNRANFISNLLKRIPDPKEDQIYQDLNGWDNLTYFKKFILDNAAKLNITIDSSSNFSSHESR